MTRSPVVLLPGFGGSADQPILLALERALPDHRCLRLAPPRFKVTPELTPWVDWLEAQTRALETPILVGRSFGGRLALRLAHRREVAGVVLLGFPIGPRGKPRPLDEALLKTSPAATLVVQGDADELGPLPLLHQTISGRPNIGCHVVAGAGHSFTRTQEREAVIVAARWIHDR